MANKKLNKTNAVRILDRAKIDYVEHAYSFQKGQVDTNEIVSQIETTQAKIFKTLVATGKNTGPIVAVIPITAELDLKKLAKTSANKKVEMLHLKDLEATTGYIRGGCSPIGMKKLFPTYIDQSALNTQHIVVSAGKIGLQVELKATDLASIIKGKLVDLLQE